MDATDDDGSCEYAEENFDCDGNCLLEVDCAGECGGDAGYDECGVCEGDGSVCSVSLEFGSVDSNAGTMEILMTNQTPVAGFQFEVNGDDEAALDSLSVFDAGFKLPLCYLYSLIID